MKEEDIKKCIVWYSQEKVLYELLGKKIKELINELLESERINYQFIECRVKDEESFKNKIIEGICFKPEEMQDLLGIRIIGYVNSDIDKIVNIIKDNFEIDKKKSEDKSEKLGIDKVGYRSIHLITKLPQKRIELPEYKKFEGKYFEIQIRTILQHAWAEIQHDRNYKFSGILPESIKRRFSLLAGHLEIADNEFNSISKLIEDYSKDVSEKTKSGELNIPIDSTSLRQYLNEKFKDLYIFNKLEPNFGPKDNLSATNIRELNKMGIKTLKELDNIIPKDFVNNLLIYNPIEPLNFCGLIRDILIINYKEKYFEDAWEKDWGFISKMGILEVYNIDTEKISKKYKINILD